MSGSTGNHEIEPNNLALLNLLISIFIKEPKNIIFRSYGDSIQDSNGDLYSIYADNGISYINKGIKCNRKKEIYQKIITLSNENNFDYDKSSNTERMNTIIDTLIEYSKSLKTITEEINDIQITNLSLKWGIKNEIDQSPCLIDCEHSTFFFTEESKPFSDIHSDILLFLAIEISKVPHLGVCFIGNDNCLGGNMFLPREKIISSKLLKFLNRADNVDDKSSLIKYITKQLHQFCPSVLIGSVPVCRRCFNHYMTNSKITTQALANQDDQENPIPTRQRVPLLNNKGNSNHAGSFKPSSRYHRSQSIQSTKKLYPDATRSLQRYRDSYNPIIPSQDPRTLSANRYNVHQRRITPSGLIYSQNFHDSSMSKAFGVYSKLPFPAFFGKSS